MTSEEHRERPEREVSEAQSHFMGLPPVPMTNAELRIGIAPSGFVFAGISILAAVLFWLSPILLAVGGGLFLAAALSVTPEEPRGGPGERLATAVPMLKPGYLASLENGPQPTERLFVTLLRLSLLAVFNGLVAIGLDAWLRSGP